MGLSVVSLVESTDRGTILCTTRYVSPGETMLVEEPAFLSNKYDISAYDEFCKLCHQAQEKILSSFFCSMDGAAVVEMRTDLASKGYTEDSLDRAVRFFRILQLNCFKAAPVLENGTAEDAELSDRIALYNIICKASHSCAPNAYSYTRDRQGVRILRSTLAINQGEDLFISYLHEESLLLPSASRRCLLQQQKEFLCGCRRCSASEEDIRVFPCTLPACSGTRHASPHGVGFCSHCASALTEEIAGALISKEVSLSNSLDFIDDVLDNDQPIDLAAFILALEPIHPFHYLSRRISRAQYELHTGRRQFIRAARAIELYVQCWSSATAPQQLSVAAFDFEQCGDALERCGDFTRCEAMYARAWAMYAFLFEPLHPYWLCCQRKLVQIRLQMLSTEGSDVPIPRGSLVVIRASQGRLVSGEIGRCQGPDEEAGYSLVRVSGRSKKIKNASCTIVHPVKFPCLHGQLVLIYGLELAEQRHLNGRVGHALSAPNEYIIHLKQNPFAQVSVVASVDARHVVMLPFLGTSSSSSENVATLTTCEAPRKFRKLK